MEEIWEEWDLTRAEIANPQKAQVKAAYSHRMASPEQGWTPGMAIDEEYPHRTAAEEVRS